MVILFIFPLSVSAQSQEKKEKIYSLLLINFAKGINWSSASPSETFIIDILGYPPLAGELSATAAKTTIQGKRMVIRQINDISEAKDSNILFIPAYKTKVLPEIFQHKGKSQTLIVSNTPGVAKKGVSINFLLKEGKLTYEINVKAIEKSGMKISSALKSNGIIVE
jgi:hypothetical protein